MLKNQRIAELLAALKKSHAVRNQSHFAEIIGSDKATVSEILNGRIEVPNNFVGKILDKFPSVNPVWLESGEGSMFREQATPSPGVQIAGDYTNFGDQRVSIVSDEMMSYLREEQRQSAVQLSQINRLIAIVEHITGTPFHKTTDEL